MVIIKRRKRESDTNVWADRGQKSWIKCVRQCNEHSGSLGAAAAEKKKFYFHFQPPPNSHHNYVNIPPNANTSNPDRK